MVKLGNALLGAAGVALLTIGVAAQTGSVKLPSLGGGPVAGRAATNLPPVEAASPSPAMDVPSPTPQPAGDAGDGGHGHGHGNGNGNGGGDDGD